jgi:hypothetical protein
MYRQRMHFFPNSQGAMMELLALGEEFNKLAADKGWTQGVFWMPAVGESEIVAEFDYPDLATYQREDLGHRLVPLPVQRAPGHGPELRLTAKVSSPRTEGSSRG